jgi:hypothetical protein
MAMGLKKDPPTNLDLSLSSARTALLCGFVAQYAVLTALEAFLAL